MNPGVPGSGGRRHSSIGEVELAPTVQVRRYHGADGSDLRPPLRTTVAMRAVRPSPMVRGRRSWVLPLLAVLLTGAWGVAQLRPAPTAVLPRTVVGVWIAEAPQYAGHTLELTASQVITAWPGGREVSDVRDVILATRPDTLALRIQHGDPDAPQELSLSFVTGEDEYLVLRNPEAVRWVRRLVAAPSAGETSAGSASLSVPR